MHDPYTYRYPRTLDEAFPNHVDRAYPIHHYRSRTTSVMRWLVCGGLAIFMISLALFVIYA